MGRCAPSVVSKGAIDCLCQLLGSIILHLRVNVHSYFAVLVTRKILYRFGVHTRRNEVRNVRMSEHMRRHMEVQRIAYGSSVPRTGSHLGVEFVERLLSIRVTVVGFNACRAGNDMLPNASELSEQNWIPAGSIG